MNVDKDIIIIGHPRSGSYWMQSCLPHFNCREAFNTINFDITGIGHNNFTITPYKNVILSKEEEQIEIQKRFDWLSKVSVPKCVKILTFQFQYAERKEYNQDIFDWVNKQDADIYWIKRIDKIASFKSLLIADATGKYIGAIPEKKVSIDLNRIPWLLDSLSYSRDEYIREQIKRPIIDVKYEDLLMDDSFDKSTSSMVEQKSKDVEIENYDQVLEYIKTNGLEL